MNNKCLLYAFQKKEINDKEEVRTINELGDLKIEEQLDKFYILILIKDTQKD